MTLLLACVVVSIAMVVLSRRWRGGRSNLSARPIADFRIEAKEEESQQEREFRSAIIAAVEARIRESDLFLPNRIPEVMESLKAGSRPFGRMDFTPYEKGDTVLSVAEKRALGLNARAKYSHRLIGFYRPEAFATGDPTVRVSLWYWQAFQQACRRRSVTAARRIGAREMVIRPMGDDQCAAVRRCRKRHPIDCLPELPLRGCTAQACMCSLEAVIPEELEG